jgi:hypothetical protein
LARAENFTYNGYVVGGSGATATTELVGMRFTNDLEAGDADEVETFCAEFIITGSSRSDLETKVAAMKAALRAKNQALVVDWGGTTVITLSPLVATATGWDARPVLRKSLMRTRSIGFTRGFEFRVRVSIPSNYTDPNLTSQNGIGRRTSSVSLRWDAGTRRVVTISGKFHQTASSLPRAKTTTAALNNPTGTIDTYCVARLAKIDPAVQWTIGARSESDNNTQTELVFTREYYETIAGRFVATPEISFRGSRVRWVTIRGTFFRTYSSTYNGAATRGAKENYNDVATGGYAYAVTQLAALPTELGSPLTVGTDCELVSESVTPNDQDDRLEYVLVFRELLFKQSQSAASKDDPEIVNDQIKYLLDFTPLDDSSVPASGGAGNPNPFSAVPALGGAGGKPAGTGASGTLDKSSVPPVDPLGGSNPGTTSGTRPTKPVLLKIEYTAEISKTVLDPRTKWYTDIRPWLVGQWAAELGLGPTYLVGDHFDESAQDNMIHAFIVAVCLPGALIAYKLEEAIQDDIAESLDPAMTGTPYEYLRQQELPERIKYRRHTATYRTGGFDPSVLLTESSVPGYVVLRRSVPSYAVVTKGIADLDVAPCSLTTIQFVEEMKYVARNVGPPPGAPPNGAAVASQGSVTTPDNPGGK